MQAEKNNVTALIKTTNDDFLNAIFRERWQAAHVTAFPDDPCNIHEQRRGICWGGGAAGAKLRKFRPNENQYYCISLFTPQDGYQRRRKGLFEACYVIVADDVKEKLPIERVNQLPKPSYKLLTSAGSEQWGWILDKPYTDRAKVENLLDGLVAKGLAPDGTDPGMKGSTRYVRLPNGVNSKAQRWINGGPFVVRLTEWAPERLYSIDDLANVFDIDLNAPRGDNNAKGMALKDPLVRDHPVMKHVEISGVGADNWIRLVKCPNADKHSGGDPSGAAIQINADGSVNFTCHHGHCNGDKEQKITGDRAISLLEAAGAEGLTEACRAYQEKIRVAGNQALAERLEGIGVAVKAPELFSPKGVGGGGGQEAPTDYNRLDPERYIYMAPHHKFYDVQTGEMISREAIRALYIRQFPGGKQSLTADRALLELLDPETGYADVIGWLPTGCEPVTRKKLIYSDRGRRVINTWKGFALTPVKGDVSLWLDHLKYLIEDKRDRQTVLHYLAYLFQHPDKKPGFFIGHRGSHRIGKDLFYRPIMRAMGLDIAREVEIDQLLGGWGDYAIRLKLAVITEVDKMQDKRVANAMKTWAAPTASGVKKINLKGGKVIEQADFMGGVMMSNKKNFIAIEQNDRRYLIVDSWVEPKPEAYYKEIDEWYETGDAAAKIMNYLLNLDLSGYNGQQLPYINESTRALMQSGRSDYEQDLEALIEEREPPFHLPAFTVKELKRAREEHKIKGGNNGIEEALERLGFIKYRGTRKIDGKTAHTPTFFASVAHQQDSLGELYDLFQTRGGLQTG